MNTFVPAPGYGRIKQVSSFEQLLGARFTEGVNALCWSRVLPGDFAEVVALLRDDEQITSITEECLTKLPLSLAGRAASDCMLSDLSLLRDQGLKPELNCIRGYPRDPGIVPTDVYSFHVDRAPVAVDTWLCTYYGAASQGLRNDEAVARVEEPATRAALLALFGGQDDARFREFLEENNYDLHYAAGASARPWSFGVGNLWRVAVDWPGSLVPPCIHRAPEQSSGPAGLLLIS